MTTYGMPFLLEDKTGKFTESDFTDINDRLCLRLRCTAPTAHSYAIYNITYDSEPPKPIVVLEFGPNHALGSIKLGSGPKLPMAEYLAKLSPQGSSKTRKFTGSDGQEYRWSWRSTPGHEWTCTNASESVVAFYTLKLSSEPEYSGSSGCMLTVDEAYPHLIPEMLASLVVMRRIAAYNL
ncbi:hypothetical protein BJ138DRAFT_1007480 [Hygrophoropsis aurantiaca]|uniref:Uncharacterized protein n=1 Tax=Hygrophoropsis aurantiaca TaxID=72124 RepID=A0ACB8AD88_9AGAM|nr:hypothetical protein BJ138DRAFT_1007480 [Hygrophoropsis aurantiaca]